MVLIPFCNDRADILCSTLWYGCVSDGMGKSTYWQGHNEVAIASFSNDSKALWCGEQLGMGEQSRGCIGVGANEDIDRVIMKW